MTQPEPVPPEASQDDRSPYLATRWIFLRSLAAVYLVAFLSLATQIPGLIGCHGILPAQLLLDQARLAYGPWCYWFFPTLAWLNGSDTMLTGLCWAGVVLSGLVLVDILTMPALVLMWLLYLSLTTVGHQFLSYQWDALLLETGFLSIFFAPMKPLALPGFSSRSVAESRPSILVLWLLRLVLFKLMLSSGIVKLLSGDSTWRDLSALQYHYWTQPIPTPIAWWAAQLPLWFQKLSTLLVLTIEIAAPFLILVNRRLRFIAAVILSLLQLLIAITGNYAFFNLLTVSLCVLLLDDNQWHKIGMCRYFSGINIKERISRMPRVRRLGNAAVMVLVAVLSIAAFLDTLSLPSPALINVAATIFSPFEIVNSYGLFRVMTTHRTEIVVEGSSDGIRWLPYEFKYKPGDPRRAPPWVAPHQPRLDWQMWFAALSDYRDNPWFLNFMIRLLQGQPEVLSLLSRNPFPTRAPVYVRALSYAYHFTDWTTFRATGCWWRRELRAQYLPPIRLGSTNSSL